jgi:hypothetical protein
MTVLLAYLQCRDLVPCALDDVHTGATQDAVVGPLAPRACTTTAATPAGAPTAATALSSVRPITRCCVTRAEEPIRGESFFSCLLTSPVLLEHSGPTYEQLTCTRVGRVG